MTEKQKTKIITMRKNGSTYSDIAAQLNLSVGTVKSFCSRNSTISLQSRCKYCGNELNNTPGHRQKSYCSDRCRQRYWQEHSQHRGGSAIELCVCPVCGKSFFDYRKHHRKYCSHACYIADRYGKDDNCAVE